MTNTVNQLYNYCSSIKKLKLIFKNYIKEIIPKKQKKGDFTYDCKNEQCHIIGFNSCIDQIQQRIKKDLE